LSTCNACCNSVPQEGEKEWSMVGQVERRLEEEMQLRALSLAELDEQRRLVKELEAELKKVKEERRRVGSSKGSNGGSASDRAVQMENQGAVTGATTTLQGFEMINGSLNGSRGADGLKRDDGMNGHRRVLEAVSKGLTSTSGCDETVWSGRFGSDGRSPAQADESALRYMDHPSVFGHPDMIDVKLSLGQFHDINHLSPIASKSQSSVRPPHQAQQADLEWLSPEMQERTDGDEGSGGKVMSQMVLARALQRASDRRHARMRESSPRYEEVPASGWTGTSMHTP
jgi:hypothetical protein